MNKRFKDIKAIKVKPTKSNILSRVTHLYLQEKNLSNIPLISYPSDVQILYLYNNKITIINNLNDLGNVTSLYLQNNRITKIENLEWQKKMKKIYLGKNRIGVLERLECMKELEELHIEKQTLSDNSPLCFDPRTVIALSSSLQVLNISHNRINSLTTLSPLKMLIVLDASYNELEDIKDLTHVLKNWTFLKEAKFIGNPLAKQHRYRENIIANCSNLEVLDNKNISEISRVFIKKLEEKIPYNVQPTINLSNIVKELPQNYPMSLQKAASASILKETQFHCENGQSAYIPWNLFPKRKQFTVTNSSGFLRGHKMGSQKNIVFNKSSLLLKK